MDDLQRLDLPYGGPAVMHLDHSATITTRMPTAEEVGRGFPAGQPVLVIDRGAPRGGAAVFAHYIQLAVDADPHGTPDPTETDKAISYVLGRIRDALEDAGEAAGDLARAVGGSPCAAVHLAAKLREDDGEGSEDGRVPGVMYPIHMAQTG